MRRRSWHEPLTADVPSPDTCVVLPAGNGFFRGVGYLLVAILCAIGAVLVYAVYVLVLPNDTPSGSES